MESDHELIERLKALEAKATDEFGRVTEETAAASCEYHDLLRASTPCLLALAEKGMEADKGNEHKRLAEAVERYLDAIGCEDSGDMPTILDKLTDAAGALGEGGGE